MKQNNKRVAKFLKDLKTLCEENDIELRLIDEYATRQDGVAIGGSFGGVRKLVLTSCVARPDWLYILVHESCHVDQYLYAHDKMWLAKGNSYDQLDMWLHHKKDRYIKQHLDNVRDLELDCEKRAAKKIKKYNLPIDVKEYVQRANAYIYFFTYLYHSRKWPSAKKSPYAQPAIWQKMPTHFKKSYELDEKIFELYKTNL